MDCHLRELFSFCFDQLTDPFSLPLEPITEYIILAFIGFLAFVLAYKLVGNMYHADVISGSVLGSIFHWILRFIIFVSLWGFANGAIAVCRFIAEQWIILLAILGGALLLVAVFFLARHFVMLSRLKPVKETMRKS